MTFPIPDSALDDRLAFIGTSGSGKTYNAGAAIERLLATGARCAIIDPLGVWWGLRLNADGSPSKHNVVIFGGEHGDLPLNENAGKIIGETVATMAESCIVDLSALNSKAAERRFMLAFLEAVYRNATNDPLHMPIDEADMFAPQRGSDEPRLQALMEQIVRRGRIRGFIPWLITQRPAVLSKDVLSQADGLVAFKLTASQDRKALGDWVRAQADEGQWSKIDAQLPTMQQGQGVVWLPSHGILETVAFPAKRTFDSSRTPKRGERVVKHALTPLDLEALKGKLASIEEEAKANDPRALKGEVQRLARDLAAARTAAPSAAWPDQRELVQSLTAELTETIAAIEKLTANAALLRQRQDAALAALQGERIEIPAVPELQRRSLPIQPRPERAPVVRQARIDGDLTTLARKMVDTLARFYPRALTIEHITKIAGVSMKSSLWLGNKRSFEGSGLVEPFGRKWRISEQGATELALQAAPDSPGDLMRFWTSNLTPSTASMLKTIVAEEGRTVSRADICDRAGVSPTSSSVGSGLKELRDNDLIVQDGDGYYASEALLA